MAEPIEPTPVLSGNDADRLLKSIDEPEYDYEKATLLAEADQVYREWSLGQ